jgi:hypothetical protein
MSNHTKYLAGAALVFAACSSSSPTAASQQDIQQTAEVLGATASTQGEPTAENVLVDLATGIVPNGIAIDGTGRFEGDHNGLMFVGKITCTDIGGEIPIPCGPATAIANVTGTWTAHLTLPRVTVAAMTTGTWTLSGLRTPSVTINGTSHLDLTSQFASASDENHKNLALAVDATYQDVAVATGASMPSAGDIQLAITGQRTHTTPGLNKTSSFTIDATLTFQPDHTAMLVIDGDRDFVIDLETGESE